MSGRILEVLRWTAAISLLIAGAAALLIRWSDPGIMIQTLRMLSAWCLMGLFAAVMILIVGPLAVSDDVD